MILLWTLLLVVTILFFILLSSFEDFSRISLAKYIKSIEPRMLPAFDFVEKYELYLSSLKLIVWSLQIVLVIWTYTLLQSIFPSSAIRLAVLLVSFLLFFNFLLNVLAICYRETFFRSLIYLFPLSWYLFFPINWISSLLITSHGGDEKENQNDDVSDEEVEVFIEEGTKEGVIDKEDQAMIESVLEFGDTLVKEIMTPRVDMSYVTSDTTLDQLIALIVKKKKSRYPVIADKIDNVTGIILAKDVFNYWHKQPFNVQEIIRPPFFVPETMRILELLKEMQHSKQKFAIVVDEFGGVSGAVTMEDIIEEIVGDIKDEYDDDSEPIVQDGQTFFARGVADVYELAERLGIEIDAAEDFQTAAGMFSYYLGKIPKPGDKVRINAYIFEALEVEKNRIQRMKIYHEKK